jgi:hypothetical protein
MSMATRRSRLKNRRCIQELLDAIIRPRRPGDGTSWQRDAEPIPTRNVSEGAGGTYLADASGC